MTDLLTALFGRTKRRRRSRKVTKRRGKLKPRKRPPAHIRKQAKKYKVKISSKSRKYRKLSLIKKDIRRKRRALKKKKLAMRKRKAAKRSRRTRRR